MKLRKWLRQNKARQEKLRKKKELNKKRKREIQSMHQKRRPRGDSQNKYKDGSSGESERIHTTTGISHNEDSFGWTKPDKKASEDLTAQTQILQSEDTSHPSMIKEESEEMNKYGSQKEITNEKVIEELKKQKNLGKSRYNSESNDGFDFDYEDDFEIEDPEGGKVLG